MISEGWNYIVVNVKLRSIASGKMDADAIVVHESSCTTA
jgi:hypothetical protein